MDQLLKHRGFSTALEIIILHLDAQAITSCRLVSSYLKNFIDSRKTLINHQRNLICQQLYQVYSKINLVDEVHEIPGPLTQYSLWRAILDHVCGLKELSSIKAFLVNLKKYNNYMDQNDVKSLLNITIFTPLQFAMIDENMETLETLLKSGMIQSVFETQNTLYTFTRTLFCDACKFGTLKVVKMVHDYLETNYVDVNPVTVFQYVGVPITNRQSFLHIAARSGNDGPVQAMPFLLDLAEKKGININETTNEGLTMWHFACQEGSLGMVKYLHTNAERYGIDLQAIEAIRWRNVLQLTCGCELSHKTGRLEKLSYLLSASKSIGIDVNATSQSGTMIHIACYRNDAEMLKLLLEQFELEHDLDFRKSFSTYNQYLSSVFESIFSHPYFKRKTDVELLKCVLEYAKKNRIDLNETEREVSGVVTGQPGINPDGTQWKWRSLLYIVCSGGDLKEVLIVIEYMEDCGIDYDINAENDDGMTILDIARNSKRQQRLQQHLLLIPHHDHDTSGYKDFLKTRMINDELTELLLIIVQDEKERQTIASRGRTLLQYARKYGTAKHVSYVLEVLESLKKCGIV